MAAYCAETDIEARVGHLIADDNGKKPSSADVALFIADADKIVNAEMHNKTGTNLTDTIGNYKAASISLIMKMINNQFAHQDPEHYAMVDIELTPDQKRLIHSPSEKWFGSSKELGH